MAKLLTFVLGLGALLIASYLYLSRAAPGEDAATPHQMLDDVRDKAARIEDDAEARVKDLERKLR